MKKMKKRKKVLAMLMVLTMVVSMLPMPGSILSADAETGLCPHHQMHDGSCGYVEAVEGSPCTHVHDAACGYTEATPEIPCSCAANEDGEIIHGDGCTYTPASEGTPCGHVHDADCGYVEAVEGAPCQYECALCAFAQAVAALNGEALIKAAADSAVPEQTITADDLAGAEDFAELFALLEQYEAMNEADQADEVVSAAYADLQTLLTAVVEAANGQTPEKPPIAGLMGALPKETGNTEIDKPKAELYYMNASGEEILVTNDMEFSKDTQLKLKLHWDDIADLRSKWESTAQDNETYQLKIDLPNVLQAADSTTEKQSIPLGVLTYDKAKDGSYVEVADRKIGEYWIENNRIVVEFQKVEFYLLGESIAGEKEYVPADTTYAYDVNVAYDVSLNITEGSEGNNGKVVIELPCGVSVSVIITELKPVGPALEKNVKTSFDNEGYVEWEIIYTAPTEAWEKIDSENNKKPAYLKDILPKGLAYVESTFDYEPKEDAGSEAAITIGGPTYTEETQQYTIVFDVSKAKPGKTYTLTYKTKLTDQERYDLWTQPEADRTNKPYKNIVTAYATEDEATDLTADATATMPKDYDGRIILQKAGNKALAVYDDKTGKVSYYLEWKVTVNTWGQAFQTLTLVDIQGSGLTMYTGEAIPTADGSITGPTLNGKLLAEEQYEYYPSDESEESCIHTMKIPLVKDNESQFTGNEPTYELVYYTEIESEYITDWDEIKEESQYQNTATLEWEWPNGSGITGEVKVPTVTKGPGDNHITTHDMIGKVYEAGKYDPRQRNRSWKITVNSAQIYLDSVTLIEDLAVIPETDNTYLPHSFTREATDLIPAELGGRAIGEDEAFEAITASIKKAIGSDNVGVTIDWAEDDNEAHKKIQIDITNIKSAKPFTFGFDTYYDLDEQGKLPMVVSNDTHYVYNQVTLVAYKTADKKEYKPNITKGDVGSTYQTILKKRAAAYDPVRKELTWEIVINDHWSDAYAPMTGVVLTDTLPEGQTYVGGSEQITVTGNTDVNKKLPSAEKLNASLQVEPTPTDGQQEITFRFRENQQIPKGTILSFKTKVDIDTVMDSPVQEEVALANHVQLTCAQNPGGIVAEGECTLINRPLQKKGDASIENGRKIDYIVEVNPLSADLSKLLQDEKIEKLILQDTLSNGLFLDEESVEVYEAKVTAKNNDGKFDTTLEKTGDKLSVTPKYDQTKNILTLELPALDKPYVVTYSAYVTVSTGMELENNVTLKGIKQEAGKDVSKTHTFKFSGSATATIRIPNCSTLTVKKMDNSGQMITAAATFGLYTDKDCQNLLARSETIGGQCTFVLRDRIIQGQTLYLRELQAPSGYQIAKKTFEINGDALIAATGAGTPISIDVVNTKAPDVIAPARLTLTKTVSGAADPTKAYHFTISLTDAATDEPINAKYGEVDFVNGVADIALKGGEFCTITIDNLSGALKYTITEKGAQDYTVTTSGDLTSGLLAAGDVLSVTFDNYLKPHNGGGGGGGGSDVPPVTPDNPNPPVDPDKPDKPIPPVTPEVPVTPETPVTPTDPDTPNVPDTPGVPDVPVYYPGDELPDPTDPNSPDEIIIMDGDVPLHYWKTEEPPIVYIDEEGVPLAGLPQPDAVPHTGDTMDTTVWWSIFAVALGLCALTTMLGIRRKYKTK